MKIIKPDSAEPDGIQVGRLKDGIPVNAQIAISLIVGQDQ
jgi:hypothetical protein